MYLNTKLVNRMEEMCIRKEIPYHRNRMFDRGFLGGGQFGHHMYETDQEDTPFIKKYNLSKILDHTDLEICLGAEFLNMDLSILDMKNKKLDYEELFNSKDDEFLMKNMLRRNREKDKQELENGFEFKVMIFERNLQIILHNMQEIFIFQNMLNCSPLVNEWLDFAKKHKINIDDELKDVVSFIEKDKGGFKLYENLMAEFNPLKHAAFNLIKKSYSIMRNSCGNRMFFNHIHREQKADSQKEGLEIELIQKINELESKMKEFMKKIKDATKKTNKAYFSKVEVIHNNNLLIESLLAAYQKLKHKIVLPNTHAKTFIDAMKSEKDDLSALETLVEHYNIHILFVGENIKVENERYQKVILFTDGTCIVLANDQSEFEVFANIKNFKNLVKTCMIVYLKNLLHKNPSIAKVIGQAFSDLIGNVDNNDEINSHRYNLLHFNKILLSIDTYFKHENILKSLKYDFMEKCKNATSFEKIDDEMHKLIREHKIKKFAESIVSSKYKHLYNKESYKLFQELYDLSIDTKTLQEMIGKKLAAVETKKMFNDNIKKLINSLNEFDIESVKIKANTCDAKIISEENEILILEIEKFDQSKKLGSASWCISRDKSYFEQYTEKGGKQYFVYDFNQDSKSIKSLIGITLTKSFKVKAAHSKSDSQFKDKEMIDYLIQKVKAVEAIETPPVAVKRTRKKKVVTPTDIALLNIGF